MATVTGLTADRMLAIEAASVVDGDVVGDNLILTKHDGSTINAGNVRGPAGPQGPIGQDLAVVTTRTVLDVGIINQIRAGRQLSATDFTNMGLAAPIGLWNLSDLSDSSGNGRNLLNKGGVTTGPGINGVAATAAQFTNGDTSKALYIPDTGTNDPFRIKTGSFGAWMKTAKPGVTQQIITKSDAVAGKLGWALLVDGGGGSLQAQIGITGNLTGGTDYQQVTGTAVIIDDRWHFVVATFDASQIRIYIDGAMETSMQWGGSMFGSPAPLNIGSRSGDSSVAATNPHYGRVDEAFITSDVLSEDQIRNLYCAKISHTLAAVPTRVTLNVRRRRKGAALSVSDFPTQPLRLHNFSAGSFADEGSNQKPLSVSGSLIAVAAPDGSLGNALQFNASATLRSHDGLGLPASEQLPSGLAPRSYGFWFRWRATATNFVPLAWGGNRIIFLATAQLRWDNGADLPTTFGFADGGWHFLVATEDNAAIDGAKRKFYVDAALVGHSTTMNALTLTGASKFGVGCDTDGTSPLLGGLDCVFVCGYVLTPEQIFSLYAKGSQMLAPSPKIPGDHVEALTATDILATFDSLESQHAIDLGVA